MGATADPEAERAVGLDGRDPGLPAGVSRLTNTILPTFNDKREVFGSWETIVTLNYMKNETGRETHVKIESRDGDVVYLQDADGRVRKAALPWSYEHGVSPNQPLPTIKVPKQANLGVQQVNLTHLFGQLKPGRYTMAIETPAGRVSVDGKASPKIISKPWSFDVVAMSATLKKKISEPTKTPAGITLTVVKTKNHQGQAVNGLKLTNGSKKTISYTGYGKGPSGITNYQTFCGDGKWRTAFQGLCGTGMVQKKLNPGESAIISFTSGAFVPQKKVTSITRTIIGIYVEGEKGYHTIAAKPLVQIVDAKG